MASAIASKGRKAALLGTALSAAILAVFIARLDWAEFSAALSKIRVSWVALACFGIICGIALRALRWSAVSRFQSGSFLDFWHATVLGYLGNTIYPARAGEVLRVIALCHALKVRPGQVMASSVADRLGDVVVVGVIGLTVLAFGGLGAQRPEVMLAIGLSVAVPVSVLVAFVRWGALFVPWVRVHASRLPRFFAERIPHWYEQAVEQTALLRRPRVLAVALGVSLLAVSFDYLAVGSAIAAMGWSLPWTAAVIVGVLVALGSMIPAAPGYVGIYQVACVLGLKLFGVSEAAALAFSIVLQVIVVFMICTQGLVALAHYGWSLRGLNRSEEDISMADN